MNTPQPHQPNDENLRTVLQQLCSDCVKYNKNIHVARSCYERGIESCKAKQLKKLGIPSLYPTIFEHDFPRYQELMHDRFNTGVSFALDYILFDDLNH